METKEEKQPTLQEKANVVYSALRSIPATADVHDALKLGVSDLLREAEKANALEIKCTDLETTNTSQASKIKELEEKLKKRK
jgi:hypothetical protein